MLITSIDRELIMPYFIFSLMTKQSLLSLLVVGMFIALFITIGTKLKGYGEIGAVVVLCGSLTALSLLYIQKHPETLDMLENHPTLTLVGVTISVVVLISRLFKK